MVNIILYIVVGILGVLATIAMILKETRHLWDREKSRDRGRKS